MNVDAQVHLHVISRYETPRRWGGREFTDENWGQPVGTTSLSLEATELTELAADLLASLNAQA